MSSDQQERVSENMWHRWPLGSRMRCTGPDFWRWHGLRCVCGCAWCIQHKITGAHVHSEYPVSND